MVCLMHKITTNIPEDICDGSYENQKTPNRDKVENVSLI